MKPGRPLADERARARLAKLEQLEARLTAKIDALNARRATAREEAETLAAQLRGQLTLPLASTRPTAPTRAKRAA